MSIVAEFASCLHRSENRTNDRVLTPVNFPARYSVLKDIRAAVFDVYGTLINYWRPEFSDRRSRENILREAMRKTAEHFGFSGILREMNPQALPEVTLQDLYHGLIALAHEKSRRKGIDFPEVRIEEVWRVILMMLQHHGFKVKAQNLGDEHDLARCMAYFYHFHAMGRGLYPGVIAALEKLKAGNILLGIVSNAQFYTPMDLTLLVRDQSNDAYDDFLELFDIDLVVFSFELGCAKPSGRLFRRLYDSLYEYQILPSQTVFVGNDMLADIKPASKAGMKTALFTGDSASLFNADEANGEMPDIVFESWDQLPQKLSFYSGKETPV